MKPFSEVLAGLESVDHLDHIELLDSEGNSVGLIGNNPGSQGSLMVYHHLWKKHGAINPEAAREGLELYAEHTEDALIYPGTHRNIERLFSIVENDSVLNVRCHDKN